MQGEVIARNKLAAGCLGRADVKVSAEERHNVEPELHSLGRCEECGTKNPKYRYHTHKGSEMGKG